MGIGPRSALSASTFFAGRLGLHGHRDRIPLPHILLLILLPGNIQQIRIREADLEAAGAKLINNIDNAVLQIERRQPDNERRNRIDQVVRISRQYCCSGNANMDLFQELIIGPETRRVSGHPLFKEIARL